MKKIVCIGIVIVAIWSLSYHDENCVNWVPQTDGSWKTTGFVFDKQKFPDGRIVTIGPWNNSRKVEYPNGEWDQYVISHGRAKLTAYYRITTGKITIPQWPEDS